MYEESNYLKKIQKRKFNKEVKWISNFDKIQKGPVIFFGNEFFDAIPIKQFQVQKGHYLEKFFRKSKYEIKEFYKKAKNSDEKKLRSFNSLKGLNFIEYPELGFQELDKIIKKILLLSGGILLIDYGYLQSQNLNTLQSIKKHEGCTYVVPRKNWTSGSIYDPYDDDYSANTARSYYVLTEDNNVYIVLQQGRDGNGTEVQSTVKPTGQGTEPFATADGYVWKFLYAISGTKANSFLAHGRQ